MARTEGRHHGAAEVLGEKNLHIPDTERIPDRKGDRRTVFRCHG